MRSAHVPKKTREVEIFWTRKGRRRLTVALSKRTAWDSLKDFWGFEEAERDLWSAERETRRLVVVRGKRHDCGTPESPRWHVSWHCPRCHDWHDTDVKPSETPPAVWLCEHWGDELFLIAWLVGPPRGGVPLPKRRLGAVSHPRNPPRENKAGQK
jgi:hypothetical protein